MFTLLTYIYHIYLQGIWAQTPLSCKEEQEDSREDELSSEPEGAALSAGAVPAATSPPSSFQHRCSLMSPQMIVSEGIDRGQTAA